MKYEQDEKLTNREIDRWELIQMDQIDMTLRRNSIKCKANEKKNNEINGVKERVTVVGTKS